MQVLVEPLRIRREMIIKMDRRRKVRVREQGRSMLRALV
jgi:hypothetical protein